MLYHERGRHNPFDAYMMGFCIWLSPRQILILEKMCKIFEGMPEKGPEEEAFIDFKVQIEYEAEIKRKKYLGG